ncbi:hypothetical protein IJE86_08015 [bacterium]|nr:hypothetical protein [bacterium]
MGEFIKSIFETPVNLWTLPQELFVFAMAIIILVAGYLIIWGVISIIDRLKYKGCTLKKVAPSQCNGDCKGCSFTKHKNKKKGDNER